MGVLPIYMGVKGEENAGLTVSFLYFAMNKNASEKDQKATKQFLDYILNDDEARDIITNEAGFETPFKSYAKAALIIGLVAAVTAPFGTWIAGAVSPRVGSIMFAIYLCVLLIRSFFVAVKATRSARASA